MTWALSFDSKTPLGCSVKGDIRAVLSGLIAIPNVSARECFDPLLQTPSRRVAVLLRLQLAPRALYPVPGLLGSWKNWAHRRGWTKVVMTYLLTERPCATSSLQRKMLLVTCRLYLRRKPAKSGRSQAKHPSTSYPARGKIVVGFQPVRPEKCIFSPWTPTL
jgi:hypothetical protein